MTTEDRRFIDEIGNIISYGGSDRLIACGAATKFEIRMPKSGTHEVAELNSKCEIGRNSKRWPAVSISKLLALGRFVTDLFPSPLVTPIQGFRFFVVVRVPGADAAWLLNAAALRLG
jgi:hypothetical protein